MNDITLEDSELDENIFSTGDIILCHSNPPPGKKYDPGLDGIIETDIITIDLISKNIQIFMENSNEKVQIMSK